MKHEIIYEDKPLDGNPPSSLQEDATEVYCWGVVGILLTVVPLVASVLSVFLLPFMIIGAFLSPNNENEE